MNSKLKTLKAVVWDTIVGAAFVGAVVFICLGFGVALLKWSELVGNALVAYTTIPNDEATAYGGFVTLMAVAALVWLRYIGAELRR